MKTEPTEAYEGVKYYEAHNINIDAFRAKKLCDMAFYEGQSSPNIEPLEWRETSSRYFAESPVGNYAIVSVYNFNEKELCRLYFNGRIMACDIDHDEAKSAAQADFEKRVMECLDIADNSNKQKYY